jgi:hypothetical protein
MESALVFNRHGCRLFWHLPADRSQGALPDSRPLWDLLWENREQVLGVAHTHPWDGDSWFSGTDVTTFAAIEQGLGKRLIWPVLTFTDIGYFEWVGPKELDYREMILRRFRLNREDIEQLRALSR